MDGNLREEKLTFVERAPELQDAIDRVSMEFWGKTREPGFCVKCGREVKPEDFRDDLSLKEYRISALCQECQDLIFELPEEMDEEPR